MGNTPKEQRDELLKRYRKETTLPTQRQFTTIDIKKIPSHNIIMISENNTTHKPTQEHILNAIEVTKNTTFSEIVTILTNKKAYSTLTQEQKKATCKMTESELALIDKEGDRYMLKNSSQILAILLLKMPTTELENKNNTIKLLLFKIILQTIQANLKEEDISQKDKKEEKEIHNHNLKI